MMKKLPLGIQTFSEMIGKQYLYVDKTREIERLLDAGKYIFLARPRRFGKSLLVSTLKELFSGNKELFNGLYIYNKLDWQAHPVIHLDFSKISYHTLEAFHTSLSMFLQATAETFGVTLIGKFVKDQFAELIQKLAQTAQKQVVVLIDEYDKPIVDYIEDQETAQNNRNILRDFYGVLKGSDPYLHFVFLTGVSKFSRVSIFSGLNNLRDLTLSAQFGTLAGYTQEELERDFAGYLDQFAENTPQSREELLHKIRTWYNGYSWNGRDRVYNPFSILNLFAEQRFSNYWFATGTPTFLINLIKRLQIDPTEFEQKTVSELIFESYNLENMDVFALLVQTGYLTITGIEGTEERLYTLNYPNNEVKKAFMTYLLQGFTVNRLDEVQSTVQQLRQCLRHKDIEGFITIIRAMFAKIPYPLHIPQEAYYHSLFYMILELMGVEVDLEVLTDKGRIDGVMELPDTIYLIEFKYGAAGANMETLTDDAIRQIRTKRYAERFLNDPRKRILLGVGFIEKTIGYKIEYAL